MRTQLHRAVAGRKMERASSLVLSKHAALHASLGLECLPYRRLDARFARISTASLNRTIPNHPATCHLRSTTVITNRVCGHATKPHAAPGKERLERGRRGRRVAAERRAVAGLAGRPRGRRVLVSTVPRAGQQPFAVAVSSAPSFSVSASARTASSKSPGASTKAASSRAAAAATWGSLARKPLAAVARSRTRISRLFCVDARDPRKRPRCSRAQAAPRGVAATATARSNARSAPLPTFAAASASSRAPDATSAAAWSFKLASQAIARAASPARCAS